MTERLIIRNFAGLDNIDIELGRINIFIGPQASGKSVCLRCIEFFKGFVPEIINRASDGMSEEDFRARAKGQFSMQFDFDDIKSSFSIRYYSGDNYIDFTRSKNSINLRYSSYYKNLFKRIKSVKESNKTNNASQAIIFEDSIRTSFRDIANSELGEFNASWVTFIPASRAIYALTESKDNFSADRIINSFNSFYNLIRQNNWEIDNKEHHEIISRLSLSILKGKLVKEKNGYYIIQENGLKTKLINSSSGQQEALPLVKTLQYLSWIEEEVGYIVCIEEPEAHLHPRAQYDIIRLLAAVYNIHASPLQFFITSHSPYILSSFNNLIYAGQIDKKIKKNETNKRKELYNVVKDKLQMSIDDFRVYGLENGKAQLLIDNNLGLLMADSLDSVSDVVAEQFSALMALDSSIYE